MQAMIVECSSCSKKLKVPDSAAGKKVRCPSCEHVIRIPLDAEGGGVAAQPRRARPPSRKPVKKRPVSGSRSAGAGATSRPAAKKKRPKKRQRPNPYEDPWADDGMDDFDEPANPYAMPKSGFGGKRGKRKAGSLRELRTAGTGMLVMVYGVAAIIFATLFLVVASVTQVAALVVIAGLIVIVAIIGGAIAMLVGEIMCLSVPERSGAKGLVVTAVACHALQFVISIVEQVAPSPALTIFNGIAAIVYLVCWLLFLKKIAGYAGLKEQESRAQLLLIALPIGMALLFVAGAMSALGQGQALGVIALALMAVFGLGSIVLGVMYLSLLYHLGKGLRGG